MLNEAVKLSPEEELKRRCLSDTGMFARHVCGFDYDEQLDTETGINIKMNKGFGGIRATGPHVLMTGALDVPDNKPVMVLAPRGSMKSTIGQAYVMRQAIRNPEMRILYGMDTHDRVLQKLKGIKEHFESNQRLISMFGDLRGKPWKDNKFSLVGARVGAQENTFQGFSVDKTGTGGHYELIVLDDLINHENCATPNGVAKIMRCFKQVPPMLVPGGKVVIFGTRYYHGDLYEFIQTQLADRYRIVILDCGMTPVPSVDGAPPTLVGTPRFAHQNEKFLKEQFATMGEQFWTQYCNRVASDAFHRFSRHHFRPERWDKEVMSTFSGYILTDTATSKESTGDYTVIAYVLYDKDNNVYLADLRVGRWTVPETVNAFFDVRSTWMSRVYHVGEFFERISLNAAIRVVLEDRAKVIGQKLRIVDLPRTAAQDRKVLRISRLESRFQQGRFFVLDTVPRTFRDLTAVKVLWDANGYRDPETGMTMPSGEMVDQFLRFPSPSVHDDIPDALADMDAMNPDGSRQIGYVTPKSYVARKSRGEVIGAQSKWKRGDVVKTDKPKDWVDATYDALNKRGAKL